jgi:hypothetical protein
MGAGKYLLLLASAGLLAAGCGTEVAQPASLTRAVTNTSAATAKVLVVTSLKAGKHSASFSERGTFDFAHSRGVMWVKLPSAGTMETVLIPPMFYMRFPGKTSRLPDHKSWIAMRTDRFPGAANAFGSPFGDTGPGALLKSLTAISSGVTKVGTTAIGTVPVTEFRVTLDPAKAAAGLNGAWAAELRLFAEKSGTGKLPVEVWVDPQNLVRRITLSFQASRPVSVRPRVTQTTDFYDFGTPVRVSAPPASEVAEAPPLGRGGSASGHKLVPPAQRKPPPVSGTLSPAQAAAAEQAVSAFWAALGANNTQAAARTVLPSQRACLGHIPPHMRFTVASIHIVSAEPAAHARATVRFTLNAHMTFQGHSIPMYPDGPGKVQWLVVAKIGGHWYLDLRQSASSAPAAGC